jgi:hypothetical protein
VAQLVSFLGANPEIVRVHAQVQVPLETLVDPMQARATGRFGKNSRFQHGFSSSDASFALEFGANFGVRDLNNSESYSK